ncbi:zinc-ribbon domain-containing protein [Anaerosinus massiliensis]|uniref:zinc-ribbon domain-containing protein n=1 Tax=Massilibacillus massiliensis TaxID=1806837 RepID=UPI000DA610C0|nr:zinc-ribbon domain-containing protein [Massilibacillus massiliensis]
MQCTFCKKEIEDNVKFCPECGEKVIVMQELQKQQEVPMIMVTEELMRFIKVSRSMLYKLLAIDDPIPFFFVGSDKRFITSEVIEWAKRNQTTLMNLDDKKKAYLQKTG